MLLSALYMGCLAGLVVVGGGQAWPQQGSPDSLRPIPFAPAATISLASLRVSPAAREHYLKAVAASRAHRDQECDRELAKALGSAPDYADAHLLRAVREVDSRSYDAALQDAVTAQRLDAALVWAPVAAAQAYLGLNRAQDALLVLVNLHGAAATSWQAKYERARAEVLLGHIEAALDWSVLAVDAAPVSFVDTHLLYANALGLSGQWNKEVRELQLYLASSAPQPHRAEALVALASVQLKARDELPETAALH